MMIVFDAICVGIFSFAVAREGGVVIFVAVLKSSDKVG